MYGMKKYLYYLIFHREGAILEEGYCLSNKDLSEKDIKSEDEDDPFEAFEEMIGTNFIFDEGSAGISDLIIRDKIECSFTYNKYLPDSLYKSLRWFNQAMLLHHDASACQEDLESCLREIEPIDCLRLCMVPAIPYPADSAMSNMLNELMDSEDLELFSKETLSIMVTGNYLQYRDKRIRYAEIILKEIVKLLDYNSLLIYDSNIERLIRQNAKRRDNGEFLHLKEGEQLSISDLKHNILYYAERLVLEIKYIMGELRDVIRYLGEDTLRISTTLYLYDSFLDAILKFKRRLLLEKKHIKIEREEIPLTFNDIKKEKDTAFTQQDRELIFKELCPSFKTEKKAKKILDEMDEYYCISINPKFPKRQLGMLIFLLHQCNYFNKKLSYETFKQKVCAYYGKDDISIKPNKIRREAIAEYQNRELLYKDWGLTLDNI